MKKKQINQKIVEIGRKEIEDQNQKIISKFQDHYLHVGELKKFIAENNLPDDALVLYQRIEDVYFEKHNWDNTTIKKPDEFYPNDLDCDSQFVITWSPIKYSQDDNLYLTAHY